MYGDEEDGEKGCKDSSCQDDRGEESAGQASSGEARDGVYGEVVCQSACSEACDASS